MVLGKHVNFYSGTIGQSTQIQHWIIQNTHSWVQVNSLLSRKLESNRGNTSKYLIEPSQFLKENPYPKGHTCFNRLELPRYPSKELLHIHLHAVANNDLDGVFGLD